MQAVRDNRSARKTRAFTEPASDEPPRWLNGKVRNDRPQHSISFGPSLLFVQVNQPAIRRELIIVNKRNEVTAGIFHGQIPRVRDAPPLLMEVIYLDNR